MSNATIRKAVFLTIPAAAYITGRHRDLIRRWYLRGQLTAACDVQTRAILVDARQAADLSQHRTRRVT